MIVDEITEERTDALPGLLPGLAGRVVTGAAPGLS
jgi:hypothetical protein